MESGRDNCGEKLPELLDNFNAWELWDRLTDRLATAKSQDWRAFLSERLADLDEAEADEAEVAA